jgi:hypothetical protein
VKVLVRSTQVLFALAIIAAIVMGTTAMISEAQAKGPCICPKIYAPVICNGGKVFPNQCVADCRHAKGCVPLGVDL